LADALDSGSSGSKIPWRFEPSHPHSSRRPLAGIGSGASCVKVCMSHRWSTELETSLGPALSHSPQGCGVIHHAKPDGQDVSSAPRSNVRIGFLRSNSRFEAVLLRRWLGLIAAGTAPPSPRCVDSPAYVGVRSTTFRWLEFVDLTRTYLLTRVDWMNPANSLTPRLSRRTNSHRCLPPAGRTRP
jgi:hypothetical protein